ncbi:MAG: hypothetical protein JXA08_09615 [Methanomicrobiaceae archaeon]|nr:hypothetical protein [Methanomicrobiaceae archaeon]
MQVVFSFYSFERWKLNSLPSCGVVPVHLIEVNETGTPEIGLPSLSMTRISQMAATRKR